MLTRGGVLAAAVVFVALLVGDTYGAESVQPNLSITENPMNLVGKWTKVPSAKCDETYPDEIEFFERPRYLGKKGPGQRFIAWDAGGYQVRDRDQVMIEISTDEQVLYQFSISENVLTFRDRDGCEFKYRRAA